MDWGVLQACFQMKTIWGGRFYKQAIQINHSGKSEGATEGGREGGEGLNQPPKSHWRLVKVGERDGR